MNSIILICIAINAWNGHVDRTVIGSYETRVLCENERDKLNKEKYYASHTYLCVKDVK